MRTHEEFIELVERMRIAQKSYFSTPKDQEDIKKRWLIESKTLEQQVDQEIKDYHSPKLF